MHFVSLIFLSSRLWFVLVVAASSRDRRRIQKKVNSVDLIHKFSHSLRSVLMPYSCCSSVVHPRYALRV